ncbi:hypothetical protein A3I57_03245 [Candidatus Beckwithbacteria bacterium RIFCSPLOWO2_02_FULL_47_23]|uniref:Uncharacterized protein n=2 Tax=Candidatus Beckwithiibacteriota TaxID=1752726 RepID=A0A1F5E1X3_9BACT|nr:MAG: hypothetical protein A3E73_00850 [Candidatus Beckwithbacteria bacterium RIFCSPHIGHO2_12_FULL_47_17]OGD61373.1 MAG: hypothetical protein A3I57_03245 [Candidatus Beckwithbacteria bacterium RIFCSPLOWO2_02_FULL_47_23]
MSAVLIRDKITTTDLVKAKEDYGDYIKVVVNVETKAMAIGGQWHADGEKLLLDEGSQQSNLWGGGIKLTTKTIDYTALINIRAQVNPSHVIMDAKIRAVFDQIIKDKFNL